MAWTTDDLTSWEDCRLLIENEQYRKSMGGYLPEGCHELDRNPTELERYIYEEEPADSSKALHFRERLVKLLNWTKSTSK